MTCDEVRERLTLLVGREAEPRARAEAERHAASCASCGAWLASDARVSAVVARLPEVAPGPRLKAGVMARIRATADEPAAAPRRATVETSWWRQPSFVLQGILAAFALCFLASPAGGSFVDGVFDWSVWATFSANLGIALPTFADVSAGVERAADWPGSEGTWVTVLCAIALAGNLALLARRGGRQGLRMLVPFLAIATLMLSADVARAAEPGDPDAWKSLRESADMLKLVALDVLLGFLASGALALGLLARATARGLTARADRVAATRSGLYQFLVGFFNFIVLFVAAVVLGKLGPLRFVALALVCVMIGVAILGLAARARVVGREVLALGGRQGSSLAESLAGGGVLAVVMLLPVVGQLVWCALAIQCFGTGLLALTSRAKSVDGVIGE